MATDTARLHAVFDLAMRVGEGLLANGAAASEVTATILRVTSSSGLRNVSVQVTFDEVTISYLADEQSTPFTRVRSASNRGQDITRLAAFEDITHRYIAGETGLEEARHQAEAVPRQKPTYGLGLFVAGFSVLGGGAALSLGAGTLVVVAATLASGLLIFSGEMMGRRQIPAFYAQALGGVVGVLAAMVVGLIDPAVNSSTVVVACIIVQLAGLASIGAVQDAVTGWYLTAAGRILETLMLTAGLVVGVRGGLLLADLIGVEIAVSAAIPVSLITVVVVAVASAAMGLGYGVSAQVPLRTLPWIAGVAVVSGVTADVLTGLVLDRVWAVAIASFLTGLVAVFLQDSLRMPALAFVMGGVVPLVPGRLIFGGLLGLGEDVAAGAFELFGAIEVAMAIAAGAVLGQVLASRVLGRIRRTGIAYAPMISAPFTTLRRRRLSLGQRRRRRRRGSDVVEPSTMTGEMTALSPSMFEDTESSPGQPTDPEEKS